MAAKKAKSKSKKKGVFRGSRRAEVVEKQIKRFMENKAPMTKETAEQWVHFARSVRTTTRLIELQAYQVLGYKAVPRED